MLQAGQLLRLPGGRAWVVGYVNPSRARIHPLTPVARVIHVPDRLDHRRKVEKEVFETGDPIDISPASGVVHIEVSDLTEAELKRLTQYVEAGGEVEGL